MKLCPIHLKLFSEKSPNKGGFYWHVINFENNEYHSITKEEYDRLPDPSEDGKGAVSSSIEPTREPIKERDYEAEARGKVRNSVAVAFIGLQKDYEPAPVLDQTLKTKMEGWVEWIMTGK